jgi:hypothetical protein
MTLSRAISGSADVVLQNEQAFRCLRRGGLHFAGPPTATQFMMNTYPPKLQQCINQHGGLTPKLLILRGRELAAIVPRC